MGKRQMGADRQLEGRVLRWNGSSWIKAAGWLGSSRVVPKFTWWPDIVTVRVPGGVLAIGCNHGCRWVPVAGSPAVPRLTPALGCGTLMDRPLAAAADKAGTLYLLGLECKTERLIVERWPATRRESRVEGLPPRVPSGEPVKALGAPVSMGLDAGDDGTPRVRGLGWYSGEEAPSDRYLVELRAGAWEHVPLPEAAQANPRVSGFVEAFGRQWVVTEDDLWQRVPKETWQRVETPGSAREIRKLVSGRVMLLGAQGLYELLPS